MNFDIIPEQLSQPFDIFTHVGESILVETNYFGCPVSVNHKCTMADFIELYILNFDIILRMDFLHVCYTSIDCSKVSV